MLGGLAFKEVVRSGLERMIIVSRTEGCPGWFSFADDAELLRRCSFIAAEDAASGMAHSLRAGLSAAVGERELDAVIVILADQPFVHAEMIERLLNGFQSDRTLDYVASGEAGTAKPPVLLSASMFEAVMKLQGDEGARKLLLNPRYKGRIVEAEPECFLDLDTPEDVQNIQTIL
jgi:molybdenum cofactor cytidylyltransferase